MSFLVGQAAKSSTVSTIIKIAVGAGILYAAYQFIKPRIDGIIPSLPSLPSLPEITLPTIPDNILPEITLPTIPDNILPEITLPTIPNIPLPDLTDIGKMEIPINIPSANDIMEFIKSQTGQNIITEVIPEIVPEIQGPLVDVDLPLLMEVYTITKSKRDTVSGSMLSGIVGSVISGSMLSGIVGSVISGSDGKLGSDGIIPSILGFMN